MALRIAITNQQKSTPIDHRLLRAAARAVLRGEGISTADISLAFVDDATIEQINWQFLKHRGPTDVVTFPLADAPLTGELVIGAELAARASRERSHDVAAELALYVIHGVLHLCGYDDKTAKGRKAMRLQESHYLNKLQLAPICDR